MIPAVYAPTHWAEIPDRALSLAGAISGGDNDFEVAAVYVAGNNRPQAVNAANAAGVVAGSVDAWQPVTHEEVAELIAAGLLTRVGDVVVYAREFADPVVTHDRDTRTWDIVGRFQGRRVGGRWEQRVILFGLPLSPSDASA